MTLGYLRLWAKYTSHDNVSLDVIRGRDEQGETECLYQLDWESHAKPDSASPNKGSLTVTPNVAYFIRFKLIALQENGTQFLFQGF